MQLAHASSPLARSFDLRAAAWSALFAGALTAILMLSLSVSVYDESIWKLPRMVAAAALGTGVLEPGHAGDARVAAAALAVHAGMSLVYGVLLAAGVAALRGALAPWIGLAAGAALYALHFYGLAGALPWLAELRSVDTLAAHLAFGLLAAQAYADRATAAEC